MCGNDPQAAKAAGAIGLFGEASAEFQAGQAGVDIADVNSSILKDRARRELVRANVATSKVRRGARALKGSQRAAAASQGIDVESGSAADLQVDTTQLAEEDVGRIREDALLRAQGFKMQGEFGKIDAKLSRNAANTRAVGTLIGGFSQKGLFG